MYSLDPNDHPEVSNASVYQWRQYLKEQLLEQRRYKSDYSGKYLTACEMHEGILTRANVPKSLRWHYRIFVPWNCLLLLPEEHRPICPTREWCIQWAYDKYGRDKVRDWYYSLSFKSFPFQLL